MKNYLMLLTFFICSSTTFAQDSLVILSPHRKSIQQEFIPLFKKHYKKKYNTEIKIDWLDQGGTADDIRFLRSKFDPKTQTAGIDLFWGGGASAFNELNAGNFLDKYEISADRFSEIPPSVAGIPLYDETRTWYASALSSFGIFYNKKILQMKKMPEPKTWADLADPMYKNDLILADPRRSGSATLMKNLVLQSMGWQKGWELLTSVAGNASKFTHSSSDPIKGVVTGDAIASMAIDFYANAKIGDLGNQNLGFVMPDGETVIDADPVAIIKGAPNRIAAERFVEFILSVEAQKILILPKGTPEGPRFASLGRMAVSKVAYDQTEGRRSGEANPFKMQKTLEFDTKKAGKLQRVFTDLLGAMHIDTHKQLKAAWEIVIKNGSKPKDIAAISAMPVTEEEMLLFADKWHDNVFRNETINHWVAFARNKYQNIIKGK